MPLACGNTGAGLVAELGAAGCVVRACGSCRSRNVDDGIRSLMPHKNTSNALAYHTTCTFIVVAQCAGRAFVHVRPRELVLMACERLHGQRDARIFALATYVLQLGKVGGVCH